MPRPGLVARLQKGLQGPLTLISAPAGSGKTSLLSEWRAGPGYAYPAAWISLDADDNDPVNFFHYLTASLDPLYPGLLEKYLPVLQSSESIDPGGILSPLINDISQRPGDVLLAFDDYHVIENPALHWALTFLLERHPSNLHLVILTRSDPPFPVARLRARGQMLEIRAEHLRFSLDECTDFLRTVMELDLTGEQITALEQRTEGWIAGLQLAALSMQGRSDKAGFISSFSGNHQYVVDYLGEEVLNRQSNAARDFLLRTSILERLNGPLCDELTNRSDGQSMLEQFAQSNLFLIPLDDERCWYRYHHLFADLLANRLKSAFPDEIENLHQRAAGWFDEQLMFVEAIEHSFAARDYENVKHLLRKHFPKWMRAENTKRILRWFECLPEELLHADPWLCVAHAWMMWRQGQAQESKECLDFAQQALDEIKAGNRFPEHDPEYSGLQAEIFAFRGLIASQVENPQTAWDLAHQALNSAPEEANVVRAIAHMVVGVIHYQQGDLTSAHQAYSAALAAAKTAGETGTLVSIYQTMGSILLIQGHLHQAADVYRQALDYAESRGEALFPAYGMIRMRWADLYYQWNRLDEAEKLLRQGLERIEFVGNVVGMIYGRYLLGLIQSARGERAALEKTYLEMKEIESKAHSAYFLWQINTLCGLIGIRLGIPPDTDGEIAIPPITPDEEPGTNQFEGHILRIKRRLALNDAEGLGETLQLLRKIAERRGFIFWLIDILILEAITWQLQGGSQQAEACLERAMGLAEPEGILRPFVDGGEKVRELLKFGKIQANHSDLQRFAGQILDACEPGMEKPPEPSKSAPSPLSKREIELLDLIAAGRSNKEIAGELYISLGTVKRHTVNIFTKLDVKNRTEAVAKAREHGLL